MYNKDQATTWSFARALSPGIKKAIIIYDVLDLCEKLLPLLNDHKHRAE